MKQWISYLNGFAISLRASARGLNYPLPDAAISAKARVLLASGRPEEALEEFQRLADLGSGRARCIVAYSYLLGTRLTPRSVDSAREMALSALSSDPGFSNFLLAHLQMAAGRFKSSMEHFTLSAKAGFFPAFTHAVQLVADLYGETRAAEKGYIQAIKLGHIPAILLLSMLYLRGHRGHLKRLLGVLLFPIGYVTAMVAWHLCIFSMHTFDYHPIDRGLLKHLEEI
jgi:TPR repeat protein